MRRSSLSQHWPVSGLLRVLFFTLCAGLAACGGGGGNTDLAPVSIQGRTIIITDPDVPSVTVAYSFDSTSFTAPGGDSGSYTYGKVASTTTQALLNIASSFSPLKTYQLTFTTRNGGIYIDQASKSSTFTMP